MHFNIQTLHLFSVYFVGWQPKFIRINYFATMVYITCQVWVCVCVGGRECMPIHWSIGLYSNKSNCSPATQAKPWLWDATLMWVEKFDHASHSVRAYNVKHASFDKRDLVAHCYCSCWQICGLLRGDIIVPLLNNTALPLIYKSPVSCPFVNWKQWCTDHGFMFSHLRKYLSHTISLYDLAHYTFM